MINPIPERTINFRAYGEGNTLLGVATVDLPDVEAMSDTVSGAGIAGEVESPTLGHFGPMSMTINWRTFTGDALKLNEQRVHAIELRASQQINEASTGILTSQSVRVVTRCTPKTLGLGTLEVAAASEPSSEFEVSYLKVIVGSTVTLEIDKFNFKYVVNGIDFLAKVRLDMGMI